MQIADFYKKVDGDYAEVKSRLMTDERILKYLGKFPAAVAADFDAMRKSIADEDWELGFRSSHTLKGNCLNLGLQSLFVPISALCENLRGGSPVEDCAPMLAACEEKFKETLDAIAELLADR